MDATDSHTPESSATEKHHECVFEATEEIFRAACGLNLERCDDEGDLGNDGAVIGMISIVGDVEWSLFVGLPKSTAVSLAEAFAGFRIPFDSPDMGDAVGEVANILAGDVKRRLENRSVSASISLPNVIRAESLEVMVQRGTSATRACYSCDVGKIWTGVISPATAANLA